MKKGLLCILLCLVSLSLNACISELTVNPEDCGTVMITTASVPEQAGNGWTAHIVFSRGKHELREEIFVDGTSVSTELQIPVGTWDLSMLLIDNNDIINYQAKAQDITIFPDQPIVIDFQLQPAEGLVMVNIDLSAFPQEEQVLRARVHFNGEFEEIIRDNSSEPLAGEFSIPPGSYDFKVELFTESFRIGDKIDPGIWQTIHIEPLSEQTIVWSPFLENLMITADIYLVPDPPLNFSADHDNDKVYLNWDLTANETISSFNIYLKYSPFEPYEKIGVVDSNTAEFVHSLDELSEHQTTLTYTVAACSDIITGYRCQPVTIDL